MPVDSVVLISRRAEVRVLLVTLYFAVVSPPAIKWIWLLNVELLSIRQLRYEDVTSAQVIYIPSVQWLVSSVITLSVISALAADITDNKQDFSDWETDPETGNATYTILAIDAKGNQLEGWLGAASTDEETINVFNGRDLDTAAQSWIGDISAFDADSAIEYSVQKSNAEVTEAFTSAEPVPIKKGSDGDLLDAAGDLDPTEAVSLLANGYAGTIDDQVLDTENIYFSLVFDCGYPSSVKTQMSSLVQTRRDCLAVMDNGDNATYALAMTARNNSHTFNNFYCALYEEYNKVYDIFTGQDVWFSPIYHMSYLIPRNDNVAEIWFAAAGFNRASIDSIIDLRFNPKLGQRDQMYMKQLNPIVKFNQGYTVWGQLTTQAKASALQDINIVRLVLYCKRALEAYCRFFIFEQNDEITWGMVANDINLFLENIKSRRGLYNYSVSVGATAYERKSKKFHVDIILEPTRVVEQILLNFFIK